ncbi:MAG: HD domain-containing protein [Proteobacteria bacterium]|nr:HD domain-containing protein [Pseudomonadota bacterium]
MSGVASRVPKATILAVDDEPQLLKIMAWDLTALGFRVVTASDPSIALAMLEVRNFDGVVADLRLPMPGGRVFAASAAVTAPHTPVLVITGEDSLRSIQDMLGNVPVDGLVPKPYTPAVLARAIERALLQRRSAGILAESEARLIADGLVRGLALRDIETENHSRRVSAWARLLGAQLGLAGDDLLQCELGALLHDVGKIGVPDAILHKPAKLTEQEWVEMRKHPGYGREMVAGIPRLKGASHVVYCHHERWEGGGYPRGLKGDRIPIGARIFAVVDTYDAMTSDRVYRKGLPHETAVEEIRRLAGIQYDPQVVGAFLAMDQREWQAVRRRFKDDPIETVAA